MVLQESEQDPLEVECHAITPSETSSISGMGSDRGRSDAIETEGNSHANTIGAGYTEQEINDLKEKAERVGPLEAQVMHILLGPRDPVQAPTCPCSIPYFPLGMGSFESCKLTTCILWCCRMRCLSKSC